MALGDPVQDKLAFRLEAQWQVACGACGAVGKPFHAHHVVDRQILRRERGIVGNAAYDTRNALRLCAGLDTERCHMRFENGGVAAVTIPTSNLLDENIAYAFEVLGLWAADYLRREYDDTARDPRILKLESSYERAAAAPDTAA